MKFCSHHLILNGAEPQLFFPERDRKVGRTPPSNCKGERLFGIAKPCELPVDLPARPTTDTAWPLATQSEPLKARTRAVPPIKKEECLKNASAVRSYHRTKKRQQQPRGFALENRPVQHRSEGGKSDRKRPSLPPHPIGQRVSQQCSSGQESAYLAINWRRGDINEPFTGRDRRFPTPQPTTAHLLLLPLPGKTVTALLIWLQNPGSTADEILELLTASRSNPDLFLRRAWRKQTPRGAGGSAARVPTRRLNR